MSENVLVQKIEFIKGVGPNKALVLNKELGIRVLQDMLGFFPFRYEDRSEIKKIAEINNDTSSALYEVQVVSKKKVGKYKGKSLKASVKDSSGYAELVWMKGIEWVEDKIIIGKKYLIFGKAKLAKQKPSFFHPEFGDKNSMPMGLRPVYPSNENLKRKYINNRFFNKIIGQVITKARPHIKENLPHEIIA